MENIFYLKKIIGAFLYPATFFFLLLILSFFLILRRKKVGKALFLLTLLAFYLVSVKPFSDLLLRGLEGKFPHLEKPRPGINHVVVLGAGVENAFSGLPPASRLTFSSTRRILEGIRLYNSLSDGYLITSGGGWPSSSENEHSCTVMKELAVLMGVEEERVITSCRARDTYEEAKRIKAQLGGRPFLLVTSAYHMRRAIYIFKKLGLNPIPAPCDFRAKGRIINDFRDFLPRSEWILNSSLALHEYLGFLFYRLYG